MGFLAFACFAGVLVGIAALIAYVSGNFTITVILIVFAAEAGLALLCCCCFFARVDKILCHMFRRRRSQPVKSVAPVLPVRQASRVISLSSDEPEHGADIHMGISGAALSGKQLFHIADMPAAEVQAWVLRDAIAKALKESPQNLRLYENDRNLSDLDLVKNVNLITVQQTMLVQGTGQPATGAPGTLLAQPVGANKTALTALPALPHSAARTHSERFAESGTAAVEILY